MTASDVSRQPAWSKTFFERAQQENTAALAAYLLRLIAIKRTNLCVSADVTTTRELLELAEDVGDYICLLKTHADIVVDFGDRTVQGLREIARRKKFLIFEDRKFSDIGSTVQKQYTSGALAIAKWAEIINAHLLPGPAIIKALNKAAEAAIATYNSAVHTEITGGSPSGSSSSGSNACADYWQKVDAVDAMGNSIGQMDYIGAGDANRKASIVSVSTTISTRTEVLSPQHTPNLMDSVGDSNAMLDRLGAIPFLRALLIVAEMSSEENLLTPEYTEKCVKVARQNRDFVMGFIAQKSLNTDSADNFITMTPGVSLPISGAKEGKVQGDGLGQQYNDPTTVVLHRGADVIIVGRGIVAADDRILEAQRYRHAAWKAYEQRVGIRK